MESRLEELIKEAYSKGFKQNVKLSNVTGFSVKGEESLGWKGTIKKDEWEVSDVDGVEILMNNGVILKYGEKWAQIL